MERLSEEQIAQREKTLIIALLLSMWAPLATGIAVVLSHSTTQLADFIRRTAELLALFVSWRVFRYVQKGQDVPLEKQVKWEKIAGFSVAVALITSGVVMVLITIIRMPDFEPGGNVYIGLTIAVLGFGVNSTFWRRYSRMTSEHYNPVIDTQRMMYRAKTMVDFCVIISLASVAIAPTALITRYIDPLGSIVVALYLIWSGINTMQTSKKNAQDSWP